VCRKKDNARSRLVYVLSFGTTEWHAMLGLLDRIAKTFVVDVEATSSLTLSGPTLRSIETHENESG
jgi:hypothetical protein